ncbi:MAG TPA: helix-turn-helix domain-containing protein, partial [Ignavibacteriales bacterium]|nr:helix-turn-helix domain-containing protein [Ignavibacteriales bacterium]
VRIIAATNKDLQVEVDAKRFREDLYFRLKAVTLHIPPLRKRKGDIEELVNFFLEKTAAQNKIPVPKITPEAMNYLIEYSWPGNIRELKNTIESAVTLNITGTLEESLFMQLLRREPPREESRNLPVSLHKSGADFEREMIYRALIEIKKDLVDLKQAFFERPQNNGSSINGYSVEEISPLYEVEKNSIIKALNYSKGNKRLAAKALKISERTLYRKIKEYDIEI